MSASAGRPEIARRDLPLLDLLRVVASLAVVHHHMRGEFLLGVGFGLPLFLVVLVGLAASSSKGETALQFARRKASFLLVPWLRWSILYLGILAAADFARGRPVSDRLDLAMLFAGGEPSLWFLPFAAAAMLPARLLALAAGRVTPAVAAAIASFAAAVATFAVEAMMPLPLPDMPVRAWLRVAPALLWGLALGQSVRVSGSSSRIRTLAPVAAAAIASLLVSPILGGAEDLPLRFGVAVLLACVGFGCPVAVPNLVRRASALTFGVYLVHPLVGKVLGSSFDVLSWPPWLHAISAWVLAAACVRALRALGLPWHELSTARPGPAAASEIASRTRKRAA